MNQVKSLFFLHFFYYLLIFCDIFKLNRGDYEEKTYKRPTVPELAG